jgi:hypothetical protein
MLRRVVRRMRRWRAKRGVPAPATFTIHHLPARYARRAGHFTANICGLIGRDTQAARYRVNDGPWQAVRHSLPRVPAPMFCIEMAAAELVPGSNTVHLEVTSRGGSVERIERTFEYDDAPPALPVARDWATGDLDAGDGVWEAFSEGGERRVRIRPGHEAYDRILVVTGAFAGARRVETDVTFHGPSDPEAPFGFGVLPLWGGRPDEPGHAPRRGWDFSLVWYYSHYEAVGMEFSTKLGAAPPAWVAAYRNFTLTPGARYRLITEVWPERDEAGRHLLYRQRMRWDPVDGPEGPWMELADVDGVPLAEAEYGVALIAHRSRVDFGPVSVRPL